MFLNVYEGLVEELDAIDNGIPMYAEGIPKYRINTHVGARVHRINSEWNAVNPEHPDKLFQKAMALVGEEFEYKVVEVPHNQNLFHMILFIFLYFRVLRFGGQPEK